MKVNVFTFWCHPCILMYRYLHLCFTQLFVAYITLLNKLKIINIEIMKKRDNDGVTPTCECRADFGRDLSVKSGTHVFVVVIRALNLRRVTGCLVTIFA